MGCICSSAEPEPSVEGKSERTTAASASNNSSSPTAVAGKKFGPAEVALHNKETDCWIIVRGKVYDATHFLSSHPGGKSAITSKAGKDCTEGFEAFHSDGAWQQLQTLYVGDLQLEANASGATASISNDSIALDPNRKVAVTLKSKDIISHDTRRFRFQLSNPQHKLGLPVGNHVYISANINGESCTRAYTPTSGVEEIGYFDLVIKVYAKNVHPKFPNGGKMSQYLDSLAIGSTIEVKGPVGHFSYLGRGKFELHGNQRSAKKIGLICGGTGITPAYQVIKAVLADAGDPTVCSLLYANQTPADILLRDDLDRWAREHPSRFKVHYTVGRVPDGTAWAFSTGYITDKLIRDHLPPPGPDTLVGMCGPPVMINEACIPNLKALGYSDNSYMSF